ncbi:MAG TPA: hypothetical protein VK453_20200 [Micromonosporaceae bacterium]|nr:hypothetical protein [Micromonosporaceae bacterium]
MISRRATDQRRREQLRRTRELLAVRRAMAAYPFPMAEESEPRPEPATP